MSNPQPSKVLHIGLWIAQVLVALAILMAGFMKVSMPISDLAQNGMGFVNHYSEGMVRFIGVAEIVGALGLLLPSALRILPVLTPIAAMGIAIIMVLAIREHLSHQESIMGNIIFLVLAVFIAWGRWKAAPIQPKA